MEFETPIGERLRITRLRRGDSQATLAALLGVSGMTVSRIERGKFPPDPALHRALARYLGISVADLRRILEAEQLVARRAALQAELAEVDSKIAGLMTLGGSSQQRDHDSEALLRAALEPR